MAASDRTMGEVAEDCTTMTLPRILGGEGGWKDGEYTCPFKVS